MSGDRFYNWLMYGFCVTPKEAIEVKEYVVLYTLPCRGDGLRCTVVTASSAESAVADTITSLPDCTPRAVGSWRNNALCTVEESKPQPRFTVTSRGFVGL